MGKRHFEGKFLIVNLSHVPQCSMTSMLVIPIFIIKKLQFQMTQALEVHLVTNSVFM